MNVLRWGRSAYETDEGLAMEAQQIRALGGTWQLSPNPQALPHPADVLVVNSGVRVTGEVLTQTKAHLVLTTTSGYDHIDLSACRKAKVIVARCPLARRDAVIEHALAAMIWLRRQLPALQQASHAGHWARADLPGLHPRGISGASIAVIGLGVIGKRMAEHLTALGANVLGVDPKVSLNDIEMVSLELALKRADIISLHCSLNTSNRGIFSDGRLRTLRPGAVLINTARGPLLDVESAVDLVRSGHLGGLAVDVFPHEPYTHLAALSHPQVLLSPHASGYTDDLAIRVSQEVHQTLTCWVNGSPLPHLVL